jgi:hypothetical protein
MADTGDAEFFEIVGGEMAQYFGTNAILAECRLVTFQSQVAQPACNIHRRSSGSVAFRRRSIAWADRSCPGIERQQADAAD